jgi:MFS family permease
MFYVGYLLWEYPTSILITRLPTAKYLAANTVFWGAVVALTASCSSFTGLMTVRFLLGVAESTITPGFMFLTSTWYTRDEMPTRLAIWFAGNSIGGLCSSLLAYGVGNFPSHGDFKPWRWMYIILGSGTLLWAIPLFLFLPDSISKAKFLNEKERRLALERVLRAGTGITENARWKLCQAKECLVDPKTWLILSIELFTQIPNGGTHSFSNIVITSFGFTDLESTLINIPYSTISALIIYGTGWLAGRYRTLNCLLIITAVLPCVIGSAVIYHRDKVGHGVQLMAYFFLSSGPAAMPLNMSLVQANYRGVTKKMTITAMMFGTYCVGNIIGPHFFRASEAPTYDTAFRTIMVCYTLVSILALALRFHLQRANSRKPMEDGVLSIANVSRSLTRNATTDGVPSESAPHRAHDNDTTDWETIGFRYRL